MTLYTVVGLGLLLFAIGTAGFFIRRNALVLLMCIELMLNAVNLILVAFARFLHGAEGQIYVFIVMTVAAAEAAVGLAVIVSLYRLFRTIDTGKITLLKG